MLKTNPYYTALLLLSGTSACEAGGFIDDAHIQLNLRNYYYNNDYRQGSDAPSKIVDWGQGFVLRAESGFTEGTVGFGLDAVAMLGVRLDDSGRSGDLNSKTQPGIMFPQETNRSSVDEFSTAGATAKLRFSKSIFRYGLLQPTLPILLNNDGRLLPMWFNGWQIDSKELSNNDFTFGRLTDVKAPGSTNLEGMRIAGGTTRSHEFYYGGVTHKFNNTLSASLFHSQLENYYRQTFLGLTGNTSIFAGSLKSDIRYFDSTGVGRNKHDSSYGSSGYYNGSTVGRVDNRALSSLFSYSLHGHTFGVGYQWLWGNSDFPFINQGDGSSAYLPTSIQVLKFTRAGERSWQARYSYNFAGLGLSGLSAGVTRISGSNINSTSGDVSENETDTFITYVVQSGRMKDLEMAWRRADVKSDFPRFRNQIENRLIFNYPIDFL